jgi:molybdopterin converting factor small subunit
MKNWIRFMNGSTTATKLQVEVRVFATLRQFIPELGVGEAKTIQAEPGTTLAELRDHLGLPKEQVKVIMRNNLHAYPDEEIADGDRIAYIPAVAGG